MSGTASDDWTAEQSLALGDAALVDDDAEEALAAYTAAIALLESGGGGISDSPLTHFRALSHRSEAFLRLRRHREALEDATAADGLVGAGAAASSSRGGLSGLRSGESEACLRRQAKAAFELNQWEQALVIFKKAQQLASLNRREYSAAASSFPYGEWIQRCQEKLMPSSTPATTKTVSESTTASTTTPVRSDAPSSSKKKKTITAPKYQYYQSDKVMTIAILEAGVQESDLNVRFAKDSIAVKLTKQGHEFTVLAGSLPEEVVPDQCRVSIRDEKVLIKLRKAAAGEWYELLDSRKKTKPAMPASTLTVSDAGAENPSGSNTAAAATAPDQTETTATETTAAAAAKPRPYTSHRNWDSIEKELAEEESQEKSEGDDAMNKLFQTLYASADENTRRAMVKSYQTSGGTVLSTNWAEVKDKDYEKERSAPKGVEWKNWEGDKLPMNDDD